jgi:hypothetical protein
MNTLKQVVCCLVVAGMLFIPVLDGRGQQPEISVCLHGCPPPPGVSIAVMNQANANLSAFWNKLAANKVTSSDFSTAATTFQIVFANWDEAGYTIMLQSYVLNNESLFLNGPTSAQIQAGWKTLVANTKAAISESQYTNLIQGVTVTERQELLNTIKSQGLKYLHSQVVSELQTLSAAAARNPGAILVLAKCAVPWLTLVGLYVGIAALAVSGPVGWGMAAGALAAGGAGVLSGC